MDHDPQTPATPDLTAAEGRPKPAANRIVTLTSSPSAYPSATPSPNSRSYHNVDGLPECDLHKSRAPR